MTEREEAEWESISVLLMMHGLKPLSLVKRTDMKDLIIFDKQSSQTMRENLKTMMEETSRQQNMIQELIETNKQLKRRNCISVTRNELQQQRLQQQIRNNELMTWNKLWRV
ncbi:centrosomal protein of 70 kDa-like isoform 1-T1 [Dama dama]